VCGAVLVGYRRGGTRLALLVALVEALLAHAIGLSVLVDPWNPWIAFLPFVLFVLLVWCVLCDDFVMLPVAVGVGSFSLQAHASYLPLVGGLLVMAVGWAVWGVIRARRASVSPASVHTPPAPATATALASQWSAMRALGLSAVVAAVAWSAPLRPATQRQPWEPWQHHLVRTRSERASGWLGAGVWRHGRAGARPRPLGHRQRR
jgi:hypothetical protein